MTQKTATLSIVACFLAFFLLLVNLSEASTRGTKETAAEQQNEQTQKNVQVLRGLPDSQLMITMNFMRASLGVSCAYCHVNSGGDKWEFEKDDKPTKQTARRHILMTIDLNKANFAGRPVVTCNTCHHGKAQPIGLPSLPQAAPEGGPGGLPAVVTLPAVGQILDKYVDALGGRAALQKIQTRVLKGSQVNSNGPTLPLEIYQSAPNKFLSVLTTPRGVVSQGFDGSVGWFKGPRGQRELSGPALNQIKRAAEFHESLKLNELYPKLSVIGKEKIGDREAFVVESATSATETERLYFDTENGLLVRAMILTQTMIGSIPEQIDFEDYRLVDGVKVPHVLRQSYVDPWIGSVRKFSEINHNVSIDAARFAMPVPPPQK